MERMEIVSRLVAARLGVDGLLWSDERTPAVLEKFFNIADQIIIYDRTHPMPLTPEQLEARKRLCSPNCTPEDLCPTCATRAFP